MVLPPTINGKDIVTQEFRYSLFLWYGMHTLYLIGGRNKCSAKFTLGHVLDCKYGGLVSTRKNELRGGMVDLYRKFLTPSYIDNNPIIHAGSIMKCNKALISNVP